MRQHRIAGVALGFMLSLWAGCTGPMSYQERAARQTGEAVGTVAGAITPEPLHTLLSIIAQPLTTLAMEISAERVREEQKQGEGLSLLTQLLIAVGSAGAAFTTGKTVTRVAVERAKARSETLIRERGKK